VLWVLSILFFLHKHHKRHAKKLHEKLSYLEPPTTRKKSSSKEPSLQPIPTLLIMPKSNFGAISHLKFGMTQKFLSSFPNILP
jgi:hypothetical protein